MNSINSGFNSLMTPSVASTLKASSGASNGIQQSAQQDDMVQLSANAASELKNSSKSSSRETMYMPQLKEGVMQLIGKVKDAQAQGGGKIELNELAQTFGAELTPEQIKLLKARGAVNFVKTGPNSGTFSNSGDKVKIPSDGFNLNIPKTISGKYEMTNDGFNLKFDPKNTITASKLIFSVAMQGVDISSKKIDVDMEGNSYDYTIMLSNKQ